MSALLRKRPSVALYLADPAMDGNPLFRLAPPWSIYPLVGLAMIATIIVSQAIITAGRRVQIEQRSVWSDRCGAVPSGQFLRSLAYATWTDRLELRLLLVA